MSDDEEEAPDFSQRADERETCEVCGGLIDAEEWHPIATEWDEDGELTIYAFCSRECRKSWDGS